MPPPRHPMALGPRWQHRRMRRQTVPPVPPRPPHPDRPTPPPRPVCPPPPPEKTGGAGILVKSPPPPPPILDRLRNLPRRAGWERTDFIDGGKLRARHQQVELARERAHIDGARRIGGDFRQNDAVAFHARPV